MFWSWFANVLHNEVLIHLVFKVLEPNRRGRKCNGRVESSGEIKKQRGNGKVGEEELFYFIIE